MIPIGCKNLDLLLGGGIPGKIITQFYGPGGSGKTNIALSVLHNCTKAGKKAVFLDTEGGFSEKRLEQISGNFFKHVLENTFFYEASDFYEQVDLIEKIEELVEQCKLIIVDSMTALYRLELGEGFQETNRELGKQMSLLLSYARRNNIPVLITNQVYSDFDSKSIEPVGGDVLKYGSKIILELQKQDDSVRKAVLKKHLFKKEGEEAFFKIIEKGLADFEGN